MTEKKLQINLKNKNIPKYIKKKVVVVIFLARVIFIPENIDTPKIFFFRESTITHS